MIHIQNGNLLKSDCDIIAHCCNCKLGFGSGIAGQIRKQLPYAYRAFSEDIRTPEDKLGTYSLGLSLDNRPDVFNLYGQLSYGPGDKQYVDYRALLQSMLSMMDYVVDWKSKSTKKFKIGLPYLIGCGLAGGDWHIVEELILNVSCQYSHDIYLYRFKP
jgi:O-acetyl-ADP-ribose deacetylase (regulator of RNase III)